MTATAPEHIPALPTTPPHEPFAATPHGPALTLSACGGYAARLTTAEGGWYPERWTLDGPEPYSVPLPGGQPEDPGTEVLPLSDGRVLISRRSGDRCLFSLLYPTGPDTGELPLGALECDWLTLLPPAPDGARVYALVVDAGATTVWLVCGGAYGPEQVAALEGRCQAGGWLDREGRLLVLNRTDSDGRTRAVTVDVEGGAEPAVLLRIGERSNDRLLLADPDSGLLLVASDAPGKERIGWGVLGSHRPIRFPEALYPEGVAVHPLATQPERMLLPESCGVALRMSGPEGTWLAVWRPQQRDLQHFPAPSGWLADGSRWTADGELLLPYADGSAPCGLERLRVPEPPAPHTSAFGDGGHGDGWYGETDAGPTEDHMRSGHAHFDHAGSAGHPFADPGHPGHEHPHLGHPDHGPRRSGPAAWHSSAPEHRADPFPPEPYGGAEPFSGPGDSPTGAVGRLGSPDGVGRPGDGGRYAAGFPPSSQPATHRGGSDRPTTATAAATPGGTPMTDSSVPGTSSYGTPAGDSGHDHHAPAADAALREGGQAVEDPWTRGVCKPIPLQQAPLARG
ncbi:hypothetical protein [Streptomyces otsuchiensis]|uniref:hypothetical protein n=1 Tax=Streptomyces otsuchiensis TaxID=2681388 RepID=UPI0010316C62|nr:hypothetical protein [Streptomyces otsuchiensis]